MANVRAESRSDCATAPGRSCNGIDLFADAAAEALPGANIAPAETVNPYLPSSPWAVCPPQPLQDFRPEVSGNRQDAFTFLTGDLATRNTDGKLTLIGDAEAVRADQRIKADRLVYTESDAVVDVQGQVRYDEPQMTMLATDGKIWLEEDRGEFHNTQFRFYARHARGGAASAYLLQPGVSRYERASYTTCADDSNVWGLRAQSVTIYEDEGEGVARHARTALARSSVSAAPWSSTGGGGEGSGGCPHPSVHRAMSGVDQRMETG